MVDRTLGTAKGVQPVLSFLQKPTISPKNVNDADENSSLSALKTIQNNIWGRHLLAGGLAGAISRTVTAPLDRAKIYTQVHHHSMGILSTLKFLVEKGGVLSLWRGNSVNIFKIGPESAVKFTAYEKIKRVIRGKDIRDLANYERFLAGAVAGGLAQTLIFPMEVLKVRMALLLSNETHRILHLARKIYLTEGMRSFYRGYLPNLLGSMPYGGIELTIYEYLKRHYTSYLELGASPSFFILSICSAISATTGQVVVYPLSLLRTRFQSGSFGNENLVGAVRQILLKHGFVGLYRGLDVNICKVVPSVSINFVLYEYISRNLGIYMT